ncbi:hypothetical protein QBC45DRAFT_303122, partial [Copromyces sp. CBS 386.78]
SPSGPWLNFFSSSQLPQLACTRNRHLRAHHDGLSNHHHTHHPPPLCEGQLKDIGISNGILIKWKTPSPVRLPKPNPPCSRPSIGFGANSNHHTPGANFDALNTDAARQHWIQ